MATDEHAVLREHEIRLDEVGALRDRETVRRERVFGSFAAGAAMGDDDGFWHRSSFRCHGACGCGAGQFENAAPVHGADVAPRNPGNVQPNTMAPARTPSATAPPAPSAAGWEAPDKAAATKTEAPASAAVA